MICKVSIKKHKRSLIIIDIKSEENNTMYMYKDIYSHLWMHILQLGIDYYSKLWEMVKLKKKKKKEIKNKAKNKYTGN